MKWSPNVKSPPLRIAPEDWEPSERAYPYGDCYTLNGDIDPMSIEVRKDSVTFYGQRGPVKKFGINGCQIDDMLTFALGFLQAANKKFPCRENSLAITKLEECLHWLEARTRDRAARGVEGSNKG